MTRPAWLLTEQPERTTRRRARPSDDLAKIESNRSEFARYTSKQFCVPASNLDHVWPTKVIDACGFHASMLPPAKSESLVSGELL